MGYISPEEPRHAGGATRGAWTGEMDQGGLGAGSGGTERAAPGSCSSLPNSKLT